MADPSRRPPTQGLGLAEVDSATTRCMPLLRQYPAEVVEEIAPDDHMYNDAALPQDALERSYFGHGRAGLDCARLAMLAAQKDTARSILDLPSGHGRVLRFLKAEYPEARLTACDILHDAVDFCKSALGAKGVYGEMQPKDISLDDRFDLIWCGSLLTHLNAPNWDEFLDLFESVLEPCGLLIFTISGRTIASQMRDPATGKAFMQQDERREAILRGYDESGFGYADYEFPDEYRESLSLPPAYGISLAQPSWVCSLLERRPHLQLVGYMEGRWCTQDVIACVRVEGVEPTSSPFRVPLMSPAADEH